MVELLESSLVCPAKPTPKHRLWISNLDIVAARGHTPLVYFYRANYDPSFFSVDRLKSALAHVLVPFYPLAGRLSTDPTGRLEIDCSGEGVLFTVARANCTLKDFKDFAPSPEIRMMFVPLAESANPPCFLLMLQITYLKCGGVVLGIAVHHMGMDGRFTFDFIRAWSAVTRGSIVAASLSVVIDRGFLSARSPPIVLSTNSEYTQLPFSITQTTTPFTTAVFKLTNRQLSSLKNGHNIVFSTVQVVAAYIWRCICIARDLAPYDETQLALAIDIRNRVQPSLPAHFLGNAVMRVPVTTTVAKLVSNPVKYGAERIKSVVDRVDNEYVRSVVDYLEFVDLESLSGRGGLPKTKICVVSWLGMPTYDADFGWGEPVLMTRAQMYGSGFVYLIRSPANDGGINVVLSLETESMDRFKQIFYEQTLWSAI